MRRFLSNLVRGFRPTDTARTARRVPPRVTLRVEAAALLRRTCCEHWATPKGA
jgi:hypothetical protein